MQLDAWGNSMTGLVRCTNEDAFAMRPEVGVFVVADGLGAHPAGERASRMAVDAICTTLAVGAGRGRWEDRLPAAFARADAALQESSQALLNQPPYLPMASTAVVLVMPPDEACAYWIHSGDSRLYRLRAGKLELLTADHTCYGDHYRHSETIALDLLHTNQLNQALGTDGNSDRKVGSAATVATDVFLLCTDGVSGLVEPERLAATLVQAASAQDAGVALLDAAMRAGGRDNAPVIVVRAIAD